MNFTVITFNEEDCGNIMATLREKGTSYQEDGEKLSYLNFEEVPIPEDEDGVARFVMEMGPWDGGDREFEFLQLGVLITLLNSVEADFTIDYETEFEWE